MSTSSITPLKKHNLRFIRDIIDISYTDHASNQIIEDYRVVIKLENIDNGRSRIHRYTDFINKWMNSEVKTTYEYARYFVNFINYVTFKIPKSRLTSVSDMTFKEGIEFLELQSEKGSSTEVYERVIKEFYYYLASRGLTSNLSKSDFNTYKSSNGRLMIESPFKGKYKQRRSKEHRKLHQIDKKLIFEFIKTAQFVSPHIALGIYFQMFGGLRSSEVVSLGIHDLHCRMPYGKNGMVLVIEDKTFIRSSKESILTSPKKCRHQPVIPVSDLLPNLYKYHLENYTSNNTDALFTNSHGRAMTCSNYYYHFTKTKKEFIRRLKTSSIPNHKLYSQFLSEHSWSTHIGRGIFSELIADMANNASEIAVMRGDSDLRSSLTYLFDSERLECKLIENLTSLYNNEKLSKTK